MPDNQHYEQVYVVVGQAGEYDDHREWCVRAFADEVQAKAFAVVAKDEARRLHKLSEEITLAEDDPVEASRRRMKLKGQIDPGLDADTIYYLWDDPYSGYEVHTIPFGPVEVPDA